MKRFAPPFEALGPLLARAPREPLARRGGAAFPGGEARARARWLGALGAGARDLVRAELDAGRVPWEDVIAGDDAADAAFIHARLEALEMLGRCPTAVVSSLAASRVATSVRAAAARALVERVAAEFAAADVDWLLLKGLAFGEWLYPEPDARPVGDVDVLVAPADAERAHQVLERAGGVRSGSVPRGHRHLAPLRFEQHALAFDVELHHAPASVALAPGGARELLERAVPILGGVARGLDPRSAVALVAVHHLEEFDARRRLDLALLSCRVSAATLAEVRTTLPRGERWRVDALAALLADGFGADVRAAMPAWRRWVLDRVCVSEWGAVWLGGGGKRSLTARRDVEGAVAAPVRAFGLRALEHVVATASATGGAARSVPRRLAALIRLGLDVLRYVLPPVDAVQRRLGRPPGPLDYALHAARSARHLLGRVLRSVRRRSP